MQILTLSRQFLAERAGTLPGCAMNRVVEELRLVVGLSTTRRLTARCSGRNPNAPSIAGVFCRRTQVGSHLARAVGLPSPRSLGVSGSNRGFTGQSWETCLLKRNPRGPHRSMADLLRRRLRVLFRPRRSVAELTQAKAAIEEQFGPLDRPQCSARTWALDHSTRERQLR